MTRGYIHQYRSIIPSLSHYCPYQTILNKGYPSQKKCPRHFTSELGDCDDDPCYGGDAKLPSCAELMPFQAKMICEVKLRLKG